MQIINIITFQYDDNSGDTWVWLFVWELVINWCIFGWSRPRNGTPLLRSSSNSFTLKEIKEYITHVLKKCVC